MLLEVVLTNLQKLYQAVWKKYLTFCKDFAWPLHILHMQETVTLFVGITYGSYAPCAVEPGAMQPLSLIQFPHTKILLCSIKRVHSLNSPTATARLPITASLKQAIKGCLFNGFMISITF